MRPCLIVTSAGFSQVLRYAADAVSRLNGFNVRRSDSTALKHGVMIGQLISKKPTLARRSLKPSKNSA